MVKIFKQRSEVTGHLASEGYTSPLVSGGGPWPVPLEETQEISLLGKILTYKNIIYSTNFLNNKVCLED